MKNIASIPSYTFTLGRKQNSLLLLVFFLLGFVCEERFCTAFVHYLYFQNRSLFAKNTSGKKFQKFGKSRSSHLFLGYDLPSEHFISQETLCWQEDMMQMAAEALVPVFYPKNTSILQEEDNSNLRNIQSGNFIDPEKALKKLLRRFQKRITSPDDDNGDYTNITAEQRRASRKILADLVLGTSIMRLRHYHTLLAILQSNNNGLINRDFSLSVKDVEHILGVAPESNVRGGEVKRMEVVKAMVRIHFEYAGMGIGAREEQMYGYDEEPATACTLLKNYTYGKGIAERISILYSLPIFFVEMLVYQYGHHVAENMARVFNEPGPITIRRNAIKCPSDEILCQQLLRDDSITAKSCESFTTSLSPNGCIRLVVNDSWSPGKKSIWSLDSWKNGLFEVQDAGSQLIARATEAVGGDVVVDYCAGNGGKTFALASHIYGIEQEREVSAGTSMDDRETRIIAHDIVEDRLRQLRGSFDRTGLGTDQSSFTSHKVNVLTTLDSEISLEREMADVVLVDAPCSSTGVLRRRPSQRFKLKRDEIINKFPTLQGTLLKDGSELVKVGGSLVYATCSICRHENEDVVRGFECSFGFDDKWKRWNFNGKDDGLDGHCLQILPTLNGTDGFFIARWKRI